MKPLVIDVGGIEMVDFSKYLELIQVNTDQEKRVRALEKALIDCSYFVCSSFCEQNVHSNMCRDIRELVGVKKRER